MTRPVDALVDPDGEVVAIYEPDEPRRERLSRSCASGDHDRFTPCQGRCDCGCHRDDDGPRGLVTIPDVPDDVYDAEAPDLSAAQLWASERMKVSKLLPLIILIGGEARDHLEFDGRPVTELSASAYREALKRIAGLARQALDVIKEGDSDGRF